ncbi:hypothetical protein PINS_up005644 [Pythium insidiosum]|nr:hypothetical protein PINS_up005644 [Pythium insidiosum]
MAPKEIEAYDRPHAALSPNGEGRATDLPIAKCAPTATAASLCEATALGSDSDNDNGSVNERRNSVSKKRLRWSTITVHEFGIGLGGSSVPSKGGPSIGLSDVPEFTWTTKVGEMAERSEGIHRFSADERVRLLQNAGVSDGIILRFSRETNIILTSRKRTLMETAAERKAKKQKAESNANIERPCSTFVGRPRMIPANYV